MIKGDEKHKNRKLLEQITRDENWRPREPGPREHAQVPELGGRASASPGYEGWPNEREQIPSSGRCGQR